MEDIEWLLDSDEFDRIIGYEKVKEELRMLCDRVKNPEKYKKLNVDFPRGLLLYGEPGVGKSLMAECFINNAGIKSFTCRKDKADGEFVEVIKSIFDEAAKEETAIILLDDIDKYSNDDQYHQNSDEFVTIQTCMDNYKDQNIFVIATANDIRSIPDSLMRAGRFNRLVHVNNPSGDEAAKIVDHYLREKGILIESEEIADLLEGSSCAQLETIINDAGLYAGYDGRDEVTLDDIVRAFSAIRFGSFCEENNTEEIQDTDEEMQRRVVYHEAGHALVGEFLSPGSVSYVYYEDSGIKTGITGFAFGSTIRGAYSFAEREAVICRALGGKAATEVVFGSPDLGCDKDIEKASDLIAELIQDVCTFSFSGYTNYQQSEMDRHSNHAIIAFEMSKYYMMAKKIIIDNRGILDKMVDRLQEKHYLLRKDISEIFERCMAERRK